MAASWILHAIYASLIGQAILPSNQPPAPTDSASSTGSRPVISTAYGDLRGIQKKTSSDVLVDLFLGIPYASPPVGKLRFNKPIPTTRWSGVRDASNFGNECFQKILPEYYYQLTDKPLARTEDCLYLNVYKPVTTSGGLLPVMVWIHGGGYVFGAGSQYEGSDLSANGVILVTINYRLDVFGFMSNGDDVIPGNYGMLDQVMALKWVKANIQSFGGDPDKVTIFGESAGSSSVSLLVLSPLAAGLISGAIMESGTSLCPWAVQQPAARMLPNQVVNLIGSAVGCNDKDVRTKLDCFRKTDAETLFNASVQVGDALEGLIVMPPVVETAFGFLPDSPVLLWNQNRFNHVDTVRGFNRAENGLGVLMMANYSITSEEFVKGITDNLGLYAIAGLDQLSQDMLKTYVGNEKDGHSIFLKLVDVISDIYFKGGTFLEADIESKMAPERNHYVYEFDHKPSLSTTPSWMPAVHGDEIQFVFGVNQKQFQVDGKTPSAADQIVSKEIQTLWTNFAKYGNPTRTIPNGAVKWDTYNSEKATVFKMSVSSQQQSYKNHLANYVFPKVFQKLDSSVPDQFVVG